MAVREPDPARDVRRAWWALALFAVSFVAAFVVGEGLAAAAGHPTGEDVPPGLAAVVGLSASAVFALPTLLVWFHGRRAVRAGAPDGRVPVIVAASLSAAFLVLNFATWAVQLVADAGS